MWAWLLTPWGRRGLYLLGSLGMLGLGVALGRYATPPRVVTVTKVEVREVIKRVKVKDRAVTRTTTTVVEPTPAGPKTTTHTETRTDEHTTTNTDKDATTHTASTTTTGHRPDWRVGALIGAELSPSVAPSLLVGAHLERRLAGPVWIGAWGMVSPTPSGIRAGAVGASLGVEF